MVRDPAKVGTPLRASHGPPFALHQSGRILLQYGLMSLNYAKCDDTGHHLHSPGIEPGSGPWQGPILPLDQECL